MPDTSRFVNPYTFIPLGTSLFKRANPLEPVDGDRYTGVIECSLTAKTPLSVPDPNATAEGFGEVGADYPDRRLPFFRLGGRLAIPGSSLRGMVRSVYEVITDSCLRTNNELLHSAGAIKKPGLLILTKDSSGKGTLVLCEAERLRIKREDMLAGLNLHVGQRIWFDAKSGGRPGTTDIVTKVSTTRDSSLEEGYFLRVMTLPASKPNHPSVFAFSTERNGKYRQLMAVGLESKTFKAFRKNVQLYKENNSGSAEAAEYEEALSRLTRGDATVSALPVWYTREGNSLQLAPAQLSRSVYTKTPRDLAGDRAPCVSKDSLCPACTLFGFVPERGGTGALAGRVRFSDARMTIGTGCSYGWLPVLAEPRQSAFEFYLRGQGGKTQFTPATPGTTLSGRKVYWHHAADNTTWRADGARVSESAEIQNNSVEVANAGTAFSFKVFVDGVSKQELNTLVWALSLGQYYGDDGQLYCHKLGHGKPVGLGSVLVEVSSVKMRSVDVAHHSYAPDSRDWKLEKDTLESSLRSLPALRKVAIFGALDGQTIAYPALEAGGDVYAWFGAGTGENRDPWDKGRGDNSGIMRYAQVLPTLSQPDQSLLRSTKGGGKPRFTGGRGGGQAGKKQSKPAQTKGARSSDSSGQRERGKVKNYKSDKGYGFIGQEGQVDLFFHRTDWRGAADPYVGLEVTFVRVPSKKRPGTFQATDVRIA